MKTLVASTGLFILLLLSCIRAEACRFTPLEWQQPVEKTPYEGFRGQRKHVTWSRDRDRDFIDDRITRRFKPGQVVDVIVELNQCVPSATILKRFSPYGRIAFASQLITYVMLDEVRFEDLRQLARMDEVAMVEWRSVGRPTTDVSTRAVQARKSAPPLLGGYSNATAEELTPPVTGNGVVIAILDSGVDDSGKVGDPPGHKAFRAGRFVGGFNALRFKDSDIDRIDDECEISSTHPECEPWSGSNPKASTQHGTLVAGVALANAVPGSVCRPPDDGSAPDCAGTAPAAGLVDIQVCDATCLKDDVGEGLDWLGVHAQSLAIRVANLSLGYCDVDDSDIDKDQDDGTSALAEQVNYVAALGVVVTVAHGNARTEGCASLGPGSRFSLSPAAASLAITVAASDDKNTIRREDDELWQYEGDGYLVGPRYLFNDLNPDPGGLKPDLAAPGHGIYSAWRYSINQYVQKSGTSLAAPHVAGAAALIIEARPDIDPGGVKDLLTSRADRRDVKPYLPLNLHPEFAPWDTAFGWGLLDVHGALIGALAADVGFPSCIGPGSVPRVPCQLTGNLPAWNNNLDITTLNTPQVNVANVIYASVRNAGPIKATFNVNFGIYAFAVGNNRFYSIGTQRVTLQPNQTIQLSQAWTPLNSNHQCVQITIDFGADTNFANNVTQRNLQVLPQASPAMYDVQIENPFMTPAVIELDARSDRANWRCEVDQTSVKLDHAKDCPKSVRVRFDAPAGAAPGDFANCNIAVTATPRGGKPVRIGGVTVQTFIPKPCRMIGKVVDTQGRPLKNARVRVAPPARAPNGEAVKGGGTGLRPAAGTEALETSTDEFGAFMGPVTPHAPQVIEVSHGDLRGSLTAGLECGIERRTFALRREGLTLEK